MKDLWGSILALVVVVLMLLTALLAPHPAPKKPADEIKNIEARDLKCEGPCDPANRGDEMEKFTHTSEKIPKR